ncbi:MAG TPA: hypothetical protein VFC96_01690 [Anaerovoracaceae bacterium]|nr:hypothetical protein [Anaerovoracaceae bacterium]
MTMDLGALGLIPVALLLIIAIITKKTASSMIIAIAVACVLMGGADFLNVFIDSLYEVAMDEDTAWIFFVMAFIGILVGLLNQTGASPCFIKILEKRVHSARSLYFWSWVMIVALFIDDMIRTPVLGQLSPLYDKYKIPRASLAYLADATGTTFATLIPISSWAVFYQGVFGGFDSLEKYGSPFELYIRSMPFLFYSVVGTIIVLLFTMGIMPKLGAMKKTYQIAKETGVLYTERSKRYNEDAIRDGDDHLAHESEGRSGLKIGSFSSV